jgi:hypothetical protein
VGNICPAGHERVKGIASHNNKRILDCLTLFPQTRMLSKVACSGGSNNKPERKGKHRSQLTLGKNTVGNWVID